ncbi:MAG: AMP-binding protein [Desulfuromonadaceae bacterium]|nr:AMP-binding protein [Desulfuromonadaceae bacterium]
MNKTPLETWIAGQVLPVGEAVLTPQLLEQYQFRKLQEVVSNVMHNSPFYRRLFAGIGERGVDDLAAFKRLPFTTPDDVREQGMRLLCTSQDEIERIVTLQTSGTTGAAKRLFFTAADLELTVDFFRHGMQTMVERGRTVIIFLPGALPDSVGDLLSRALADIGVTPVVHGPVRDYAAARAEILRHESPCLVGIPTQILALARGTGSEVIPHGWVSSVLLSTDYVPAAIKAELERLWGCHVLGHYGLTETGLGGGVECLAGDGYHLREADLYTEIVDPDTGQPVAEGVSGEVVFTTLTRQGMPLVRYRTGDLARILPEPCPCGTVLKRLERVQGRIAATLTMQQGMSLSMSMLDEALFPMAGVLNFTAEVTRTEDQDQLHLCLQVCEGEEERVARKVVSILFHAEQIAPLFLQRVLTVGSITFSVEGWLTTGVGKRRIKDNRF